MSLWKLFAKTELLESVVAPGKKALWSGSKNVVEAAGDMGHSHVFEEFDGLYFICLVLVAWQLLFATRVQFSFIINHKTYSKASWDLFNVCTDLLVASSFRSSEFTAFAAPSTHDIAFRIQHERVEVSRAYLGYILHPSHQGRLFTILYLFISCDPTF